MSDRSDFIEAAMLAHCPGEVRARYSLMKSIICALLHCSNDELEQELPSLLSVREKRSRRIRPIDEDLIESKIVGRHRRRLLSWARSYRLGGPFDVGVRSKGRTYDLIGKKAVRRAR